LKPNRLSASSVLRRLDEVGACECHAHVHRRFHNVDFARARPDTVRYPLLAVSERRPDTKTACGILILAWRPASDRLAAGTHACFEVMRADVANHGFWSAVILSRPSTSCAAFRVSLRLLVTRSFGPRGRGSLKLKGPFREATRIFVKQQIRRTS
jgi:hypothetical protein